MTERPPTARKEGHRVRVLSYNIHQCIGLDRKRSVERIARIISELDPDVVGLQEVDNRFGGSHTGVQLEYLAKVLGMEMVGGPTLMHEEGDYGNGLLSRCPIRQVRRTDLSFPGREPRGVIDAEIDCAGRPLRVIATHLGLQPAERRFQARRLVEILGESSLLPVVMLGDLNEWLPWGRPARWLHRKFDESPSVRTFPSWMPLFALDRVLVSPGEALVDLQAVRSRRIRRASDHLPLLATIDLKPPLPLHEVEEVGHSGREAEGKQGEEKKDQAGPAVLAPAEQGEIEAEQAGGDTEDQNQHGSFSGRE